MTCTRLIFLTACVAVAVVKARKPWFCQSYDCPGFTSQDMGAYDIRSYEESNWVATSITSSNPDPDRRESSSMFRKLFSYISGKNAASQKIAMTVPVLTKVETRGRNDYKITMMFYLPSANPPAPTTAGVFLVTRPAMNVYVRSFPMWWWPRDSVYRDEVSQMERALGESSSLYVDNVYYKAGYNSPWDYFKRKQHEVWVDSQ